MGRGPIVDSSGGGGQNKQRKDHSVTKIASLEEKRKNPAKQRHIPNACTKEMEGSCPQLPLVLCRDVENVK